jgi:amino acid transporter
MNNSNQPGLKRSLSLMTVIALGINGVIGQGIFLLPGKAAGLLGPASLVALLIGGLLCFLIALCFAEVASRFDETGGAYVYAKRAYGDFIGFEVGWMTCCVAVISWAALANGLMLVLAGLAPDTWGSAVAAFTDIVPGVEAESADGIFRKFLAVTVMTALMGINLFGAKQGAAISTVFSVAKLLPMLLFVFVGVFYLDGGRFEGFAPHGWDNLGQTTMLLLYAFVGFETLVVPAGEMENPKRNVPLALLVVMLTVTMVYIGVLCVSIGTLDGLAGHKNPVAAASRLFLGPTGGLIVAVGIAISVFGTNAGSAFVSPRRFFAMAERGDLPRIFSAVNLKSGSPRAAIILTWALAVGLCLSGSFAELAVLGVMARFLQYIPTCLAVLVFRFRDTEPRDGFRVAGGPLIPLISIALCCWLLYETPWARLKMGLYFVAFGLVLYVVKYCVEAQSNNSTPTEPGPTA